MSHEEKSGIPFSSGATYFHAAGPHIRGQVQDWIEAGIVGEWKPRVGVITSQSYGSDTVQGFTPAMHTVEEEINVEAWLESRPKTGLPRHPSQAPRPSTAFHNPIDNIQVNPLPPPAMPHRRSLSTGLSRGHGSHSWYICRPNMSYLARHLMDRADVRTNARVQVNPPDAFS